jgi:hypothetical protein
MAQVRIHEVVGTVRMVDGESLLSPAVLERIVAAVLQAASADRRDEQSRRRDTRIGGPVDDDREDDGQ